MKHTTVSTVQLDKRLNVRFKNSWWRIGEMYKTIAYSAEVFPIEWHVSSFTQNFLWIGSIQKREQCYHIHRKLCFRKLTMHLNCAVLTILNEEIWIRKSKNSKCMRKCGEKNSASNQIAFPLGFLINLISSHSFGNVYHRNNDENARF